MGAKVRRKCASRFSKASRDATVKDTRCSQMWEEEQEQDVICFDDITGKDLPWHAVRKARELELECLRDLECMRKLMKKRPWRSTESPPADSK